MPMYDYRCGTCHARRELLLKLDQLNQIIHCSWCNATMERMLSAPRVVNDYPAYECPVTGKTIEGRAAHRENLAQTGCRILEPGESRGHQARIQREEADLDKRVEATVDEFITKLPTEKRDKLAAEMEAGVTAAIERK